MSSSPLTASEYSRATSQGLVDTTPPSGKKRSLGAIAVVATPGSLLFAYATGVISAALPYIYLPHTAHGLDLTTHV